MNVFRYRESMSETKYPIEIDVVIYLGSLSVEGVALLRRKGYRLARLVDTLTKGYETIETFIIEEESEAQPRIVIEIVISYDGLTEEEKFKVRSIAYHIRRQIRERFKRDFKLEKEEPKVLLKELPAPIPS